MAFGQAEGLAQRDVEEPLEYLVHVDEKASAGDLAVKKFQTGVFYKGEVVGSTKKYSDRLLMFLLKAHDPKFRDGVKVEQPGATDVGVDRDLEKRIMGAPGEDGGTG